MRTREEIGKQIDEEVLSMTSFEARNSLLLVIHAEILLDIRDLLTNNNS